MGERQGKGRGFGRRETLPFSGGPVEKDYLPGINLEDTGKLLFIMALATLLGLGFEHLGFSKAIIMALYILGVLLISTQCSGRGYGAASSLIAVLAFNFFFTVPRFTFVAQGAEYPVTFIIMFIISLITSTLTLRVRRQARAQARSAHRMAVLLDTSQKLQRAASLDDIVEVSSAQLCRLLDRTIVFYPVSDAALARPVLLSPAGVEEAPGGLLSAEEEKTAARVLGSQEPAGRTTEVCPGAMAYYFPVCSGDQVLAVVGVVLGEGEQVDPMDLSLLQGLQSEIGFALEKYRLGEIQKEISMQAERERLRSNLLRAISHDLRTPLTSISGNASILLSDGARFEEGARHKIYGDIYDDAMWLISLVENLLSVTHIDNGTMEIRRQPELCEEIVAEALRHLSRQAGEHHIAVDIPDSLLMVPADAGLMVQVIINIVNNAIKYTPAGSAITVSARREGEKAVFEVADTGGGISDRDKARLFDMFFTIDNNRGDSRRGLGLGLSLCKSIVEAHGGEIYVKDNLPHGTVIGFTLQAEEAFSNA
ncbi:DUF4118 domain-containing protein [Zongyangia hominis]|uniref:histidine kinase n=1 Tax=Zongyangia hominis TaxID=2763677 RepID=A0A926EEL6_9FIRM|nr:DUF4118 domain-containing protein [Zongyangia hominis]MBC8570312.1 DUF4118 domain-containing protein [Zongyangia hominis]